MGAVSRPVYEPPRRRDLPMLRAAVLAILNNAPNLSGWSLQGFGMFRLYLSKEMRLHVWVPSFAVPDVTTLKIVAIGIEGLKADMAIEFCPGHDDGKSH